MKPVRKWVDEKLSDPATFALFESLARSDRRDPTAYFFFVSSNKDGVNRCSAAKG